MRIRGGTNPHFATVPDAEIPRSSFNRSSGYKSTFDAGFLIPVFLDEALPGDTFNLNMTAFTRLATPIHPFMDNLYMDSFFFAVPYRLVWDNWERFNGAQTDPADSTDYLMPSITATVAAESLQDYMGLPVGTDVPYCTLPLRAYNLIWNEWFRDQNLQDSVVVRKTDGGDLVGDWEILRRGKRHDYFTASLPWPQKGTAPGIPIGDTAPVYGDGKALGITDGTTDYGLRKNLTDGLSAGASHYDTDVGFFSASGAVPANSISLGVVESGVSGLYADLSSATAATVNQLRQAFQIQKLYERDARGGTRYIEVIKAHFGVTSPDQRLQRPEYLGGGSTMIQINPIAQTGETNTTPQGNLAAVGTGVLNKHGFTKSFTEHCFVIGLVSARADLNYQQGLHRMWSRSTRFDFYWPALAHIGEQAVLNKEIYFQNDPADDDVFGYQERFAEYRYKPSLITSQMRSSFAQTLDSWHLAQDFASLPTLSSDFIEEDPPVDRVIAVQSFPHFIFDSVFTLNCARPMPMYGVPGLMDHF